VQMPDGRWVVGYGHARDEAGGSVGKGEAVHLLRLDLEPFEALVNETVTQTLTQSQFDALVSFAFSVGSEGFAQSQVLRRLNAGDFVAAACAMDAWRKSDVSGELEVVDALVRRRAAEKAMFLKDAACGPSPSALVRAKLDHAASILGAPMRFGSAPELAAPAPEHPVMDPGVRILEILNSEPQTEALLLTQVVADSVHSDDELATAHAKPVARKIESVMPTLPLKRSDADEFGAFAFLREFTSGSPKQTLAHAGLVVLMLVGAVLIGLGMSVLFEGRDEFAAMAGGVVLTGPGLAAVLFAASGLLRAPYGKVAD
jgi:lysozyme